MKISYNWIKQFLLIDWDAKKTGELLTDLGLEVEGIESFESVNGGLEGVVIGKVLTCEPHSNADRLKVAKVDIGSEEPVQIVCGAPNVEKGQMVPVATIGTTLYDKDGSPWKIKKGKIRGEQSEGMICAEDELGLSDNHEGIMVLNTKLKPGSPLTKHIEIESDQVFEIGLTPNRSDAMSHYGVARDLKAGLLQKGISLELITPSTTNFNVENRTHKVDVVVEDKDRCPRYCGITISGLTVTDSPKWIQNRLRAIGLTPINNVVDCTNYVLHELGQPLHAFDADKISGKTVHVKTYPTGTKFTTLDEVERELHEEDLMICDDEKPMCIAGVFGGIDSGVSNETTSIFLESAYFDPISIRKTAKRHGLNTDASFRFERGIDPNITEYAQIRAALLIKEVAGGHITSDPIDVYSNRIEDHQVFLNFEKTNQLIGEEIPRETIKSILTSLDIKINNVTEAGLGMTIPAFRNDVTREADVIEEILRVYGYNNVIFTEKLNASVSSTNTVEDHKVKNKISSQLTALGFDEMLSNSLTNPKYTDLTDVFDSEHNVTILNPLSNDLSVMRQTLLFNGLEAVAYNYNRKASRLKLFEFGKTYHQFKKGREEFKHLSLLVSGIRNDESWSIENKKSDFFYFKGIIQSVLEHLGIIPDSEEGINKDIFSEGLTISKNKKILAEFGVVNKKIADYFNIEEETYYADFSWDTILDQIPSATVQFKEIPKFPKVRRDLALLLDESISFRELHEVAKKAERNLLKDIVLFDVYTGKSLPKGKKSYALSFTLQDDKKTLTDKQIDKIMKKLQLSFEREFGATLR